MSETNFSRRLSYLMKERKISGQRIGDAIGKTQRTISRYANGEVNPDIATKNKIYKAIAEISGIEDDGKPEELLEAERAFEDYLADAEEAFTEYEYQIGEDLAQDEIRRMQATTDIVKGLSDEAILYYIQNMKRFHLIKDWEYEVLDVYKGLSVDQQRKLLEFLERYDLRLDKMKDCSNISAYIEMIEISKGRPTSLKSSKKENSDIANSLFEKWDEEYNHLLYESTGRYYFPEKPEFLSFDPSDWYFLLRIAIFELYDDDMKCLWCGEEGEHGELYIHSNLYLLMDAVDNGLFKEKK